MTFILYLEGQGHMADYVGVHIKINSLPPIAIISKCIYTRTLMLVVLYPGGSSVRPNR